MNILIVEDNDLHARFLSQILDNKNYRLKVASTGREAIQLIHNQQFDLTIIKPEGYTINCFDIKNHQIAFIGSTWNHIQEVYF